MTVAGKRGDTKHASEELRLTHPRRTRLKNINMSEREASLFCCEAAGLHNVMRFGEFQVA